MPSIYYVGSHLGSSYFNTAKEADRYKPGGESPESFTRVDAAGECNQLAAQIDDLERELNVVRGMLYRLWTDNSKEDIEAYFEANPMATATHADRDGQRSYGV